MSALLVLAVSAVSLWLAIDPPDKAKDIERRFNVTPSQRIEIAGFSGSQINFTSWDSNTVYVKLKVRIESSDREYEKRWIESVQLTESATSSSFVLTLEEPEKNWSSSGGFWRKLFGSSYVRKEISGEILVPRSNALRANMPYATVSLDGMKGELEFKGQSNTLTLRNCSSLKDIDNNYGKTTIEASGGNMRLNSQSGTLTIADFEGTVQAQINYTNATLSRVSKAVTLNSQSAKLQFEDIRGDLTVHANYSTITVANVAGFADIQTQSGTVRVKQAKGVHVDAKYSTIEISDISGEAKKDIIVRGQSGKVSMENVIGNVKIDDPYSTVNLRKVRGNVELSTQSGRVTGEEISGNWSSETKYSSVTLRGLSAQTVVMTNSSNPIDVELKTVPTKVDIKNEYAGVKVTIPPGYSGDVTLEATYGNVESDFPIRVKSLGNGAYGVGKVGSGSGSILIETKSGNIRLIQR
ncbi:MAG: DUF4097 family beta strand repeat-containing protein [Bacteroidota bacterium]